MLVAKSIFLERLPSWSNAISKQPNGTNFTEVSWRKWRTHLSKNWRSMRGKPSTLNWSDLAHLKDNVPPTWETWWPKSQLSKSAWLSTDLSYQMTSSWHSRVFCDRFIQ
jgi:hypothetical protein